MNSLMINELDTLIFEMLRDSFFELLGVIDCAGTILYVSPANTGLNKNLVDSNLFDLIQADDARIVSSVLSTRPDRAKSNFRIRIRFEESKLMWTSLTLLPLKGHLRDDCYLFVITDISGDQNQMDELIEMAYTDPLTGIANRRKFDLILSDEMKEVQDKTGWLALLMIDIDKFKEINDSYGHLNGDHVLRITSERLQHVVEPFNTVARFGGDELIVLLKDVKTSFHLIQAIKEILESLERPIVLNERTIHPMVSIGVATSHDSNNMNQLINMADQAMYMAKKDALKKFVIYSELLPGTNRN